MLYWLPQGCFDNFPAFGRLQGPDDQDAAIMFSRFRAANLQDKISKKDARMFLFV